MNLDTTIWNLCYASDFKGPTMCIKIRINLHDVYKYNAVCKSYQLITHNEDCYITVHVRDVLLF